MDLNNRKLMASIRTIIGPVYNLQNPHGRAKLNVWSGCQARCRVAERPRVYIYSPRVMVSFNLSLVFPEAE